MSCASYLAADVDEPVYAGETVTRQSTRAATARPDRRAGHPAVRGDPGFARAPHRPDRQSIRGESRERSAHAGGILRTARGQAMERRQN